MLVCEKEYRQGLDKILKNSCEMAKEEQREVCVRRRALGTLRDQVSFGQNCQAEIVSQQSTMMSSDSIQVHPVTIN